MTSLTFYGGANEIGGNKFLLEDKGVRIYLDFGAGFGFGEEFFYEWLTPRAANGLEVYFEFGLVPKTPRLYSKTMLELTDLKYQKPDIDGVFISHSHSDHSGHLSFLDENIPLYIGHGTKLILDAYRKLYSFVDYGEHNSINLFKSGDKIKVKHLVIEPIHVDHSVPGAYGFIIHTSKGALVYTGDFRMHGPMKAMSEEFVERASKSKPIALLCEGTRMTQDQSENYSEKDVEDKVSEIVKNSKGMVMGDWAMTNLDRFRSFYNSAVKNNRILVIDTRLACIIDTIREKVALPDVMSDKNIRVYFRLSRSGQFKEKDYTTWERKYYPKIITYKDLKKDQKKYLMHMGFYRLMELVYLKPKNAEMIYSQSEHFLEGDENEWQRTILENWMRHFNIKFHKAHCSGHASKSDLIEAIKKINPKVLIPVHTQAAEEFKKVHDKVKLINKSDKIEL